MGLLQDDVGLLQGVYERTSETADFRLNRPMDLHELVRTPGPEWGSIYCSSKTAYGCGEHGQKLVDGLTLYAQLLDLPNLNTVLIMRLSDEARLHGPVHPAPARGVLHADGHPAARWLSWCTRVQREPGGAVRICVCAPGTRASSSSAPGNGTGNGTWRVTEAMRLPRSFPSSFVMEVMFSCQGPRQAVLGRPRARRSLLRPAGHEVRLRMVAQSLPASRGDVSGRTDGDAEVDTNHMGCDGDTVKFICIHRRGSDVVRVLTLDLDRRRWKESRGVPWKELRNKMNFFAPKERGDVAHRYPALLPDGALCIFCTTPRTRSRVEAGFICSFDTRSRSLVSAGRVDDYCNIRCPVVPYDLFTMRNPPSRRKREMPSIVWPHSPEPKRRKRDESGRASSRRQYRRTFSVGSELGSQRG